MKPKNQKLINVIITPYNRKVEFKNKFSGGVVFPPSAPEWMRHMRGDHFYDVPQNFSFYDENRNSFPRLKIGKSIYGGALVGHFGHQISEFVHRLWPAFTENFESVVFVSSDGYNKVPQYLSDYIKLLGIDKIIVIDEISIVDELLIAESGKFLDQKSKIWYLDSLDHFFKNDKINNFNKFQSKQSSLKNIQKNPKLFVNNSFLGFPKKIAVFRSHFQTGRIVGELFLEKNFRKAGFFIFRPEEFSIIDQINFYLNAEKIIFTEGSAIHLFDILPRLNAEVFVVKRRASSLMPEYSIKNKVKKYFEYNNIVCMNSLSSKGGNDLSVVNFSPFWSIVSDFFGEKIGEYDLMSKKELFDDVVSYSMFHGGRSPIFETRIIEFFEKFNNFSENSYSEDVLKFFLDKLNSTNNIKSYLQIGIGNSKFFNKINFNVTHGIDDNFLYLKQENVIKKFPKKDVENFRNKNYDVVFVNNPRSYVVVADVFSELINSVSNNGVIIINNTYPFDYFSTLRDENLAQSARRAFGGNILKHWCGDIYKIIFMLNDLNINYRTVISDVFSYTVIFDVKRIHLRNIDFEKYANIGYESTLLEKRIFNFCSVETLWWKINELNQNKIHKFMELK